MKTRTLVLVGGLGLLAPFALGNGSPPAAPPARSEVAREVLQGFSYQLALPVRIAVPVITAKESAPDADSGSGIVRMTALEVTGMPDKTFRGVNAALAEEKLSVPCDLFVREISPKYELRDLGPPLPAMDVESPSERLQANFPLVTLAW